MRNTFALAPVYRARVLAGEVALEVLSERVTDFVCCLATAMRQSGLLVMAQWRDIDWTRRVPKLWNGKVGAREVSLTQKAVERETVRHCPASTSPAHESTVGARPPGPPPSRSCACPGASVGEIHRG
ncbi:hypothetical protein GCT13_25185 [Paraburkholderia sp. CNPSo 3157]|uniref:Uncharacterized protein n=1 Tax=Paraburkholderia franconis TaxID=2654983 RepID=A0A7X1NEQ0_9BURK|nr:hypothetical protein [Paraburkholderia franconis]MPW20093.1 hypothetical protein [Paraburkholderia franconis]